MLRALHSSPDEPKTRGEEITPVPGPKSSRDLSGQLEHVIFTHIIPLLSFLAALKMPSVPDSRDEALARQRVLNEKLCIDARLPLASRPSAALYEFIPQPCLTSLSPTPFSPSPHLRSVGRVVLPLYDAGSCQDPS